MEIREQKKKGGRGEKRRKDEDGDYRTSKKREVVVNMRTGFERESRWLPTVIGAAKGKVSLFRIRGCYELLIKLWLGRS